MSVNWTWQNAGNNSGVFGIQAISTGSNGATFNSSSTGSGGDGMVAGVSEIVLNAGGDITVTANGTPQAVAVPGLSLLNAVSPGTPLQGAGLFAATFGGNGGGGFGDQQVGGDGAQATSARIAIVDAGVTTAGSGLPALALLMQGGAGGVSGCQSFNNCFFYQDDTCGTQNNGGAGGATYTGLGGNIQVNAHTASVTISTNGDNSAGILGLLQGGHGADGGLLPSWGTSGKGGAGGGGGPALNIGVTGLDQMLTVVTQGTNSPGISGPASAAMGQQAARQRSDAGPLPPATAGRAATAAASRSN